MYIVCDPIQNTQIKTKAHMYCTYSQYFNFSRIQSIHLHVHGYKNILLILQFMQL